MTWSPRFYETYSLIFNSASVIKSQHIRAENVCPCLVGMSIMKNSLTCKMSFIII